LKSNYGDFSKGFFDRITYHPAEFADDEFPSGFDLVLQCDVGVYGIELLQKLYRSLKPVGQMIFVDHFSPAENLAPTTRLEWTFLDSLHDPNFSFPTLDEFKSQLAQAGFNGILWLSRVLFLAFWYLYCILSWDFLLP
jgi:SAM-dependent methyltransferase